jgi:hypothetical protein
MPIPYKQAREAVLGILSSAQSMKEFVKDATGSPIDGAAQASFLQLYDKLRSFVALLDGAVDQRGQVTEVADFFQGVGAAVVRAQKQLDAASQGYIEATKSQPHALPAVFRIPKMSAELKFAFQEVSKESVHLVFYSKGTEAARQHEQTLRFEIVAAPPPDLPAAAPALRAALPVAPTGAAGTARTRSLRSAPAALTPAAPPYAALVVAAPTRGRVLDAVNRVRALATPARAKTLAEELVSRWDEVLVVELAADQDYLLISPAVEPPSVAVWRLDAVTPAVELTLRQRPAKGATGEALRALIDSLAATSEQQRRFLGGA